MNIFQNFFKDNRLSIILSNFKEKLACKISRKKIFFLPFIFFFGSCIPHNSYQKLECYNEKPMSEKSPHSINGFYNMTKEDFSYLWNEIENKSSFLDSGQINYSAQEYRVHIHLFKNKLKLTAYIDGMPIAYRLLNGKIKGKYFSVNKKIRLIPIPFIFFRLEEGKLILGNDHEGNLILKSHYSSAVMILMVIGESENLSNKEFFRVNEH